MHPLSLRFAFPARMPYDRPKPAAFNRMLVMAENTAGLPYAWHNAAGTLLSFRPT